MKTNKEFYCIESRVLGVIGTGLTSEEAKFSFLEDLIYKYEKLKSEEYNNLTDYNKMIINEIDNIIDRLQIHSYVTK